jgi:hypothetical protein
VAKTERLVLDCDDDGGDDKLRRQGKDGKMARMVERS